VQIIAQRLKTGRAMRDRTERLLQIRYNFIFRRFFKNAHFFVRSRSFPLTRFAAPALSGRECRVPV
jgi:hypothetical protein